MSSALVYNFDFVGTPDEMRDFIRQNQSKLPKQYHLRSSTKVEKASGCYQLRLFVSAYKHVLAATEFMTKLGWDAMPVAVHAKYNTKSMLGV